MSELEFLTEEDLDYFKDLEKQGKAVIINISDDDLLSMDISKFLANTNSDGQIDPDELAKWIEQNKKDFQFQYKKNQKISNENTCLKQEIADSQNEEAPTIQTAAPATQEFDPKGFSRKQAAYSDTVYNRLGASPLNKEQSDIIANAYLNGFDERVISALLNASEKGTEEMRKLYNIFANQGNYIP